MEVKLKFINGFTVHDFRSTIYTTLFIEQFVNEICMVLCTFDNNDLSLPLKDVCQIKLEDTNGFLIYDVLSHIEHFLLNPILKGHFTRSTT